MVLHYEDLNESEKIPDFPPEDDISLSKKRVIRKKLEARLEAKRMREDLDDLEAEFDWSDFDK